MYFVLPLIALTALVNIQLTITVSIGQLRAYLAYNHEGIFVNKINVP